MLPAPGENRGVWSIVIPVKPSAMAKSRLGASVALARAIALDTVAAALEASAVVVVTADDAVAAEAEALGARAVREPAPSGLDAAIAAGLAGLDAGPCAVLLGDLPALRSADLSAALVLASAHERAFVADAEGTGTTLVTASAGSPFIHAFGPDSARRHRELGLHELVLPPTSTLRRDVDLAEHLEQAADAGLGPRTRAVLAAEPN